MLRFLAALCVVVIMPGLSAARAQPVVGDFSVDLEVRPSLGVFVEALVNGHGPYVFLIDLSHGTELAPRVVREAGLQVETDPPIRILPGNFIASQSHVKAATLALGDWLIDVDGAPVLQDWNMSVDYPIERYGGRLGVEILDSGPIRLELPRRRLVRRVAPQGRLIGGEAPHASRSGAVLNYGDSLQLVPTLSLQFGGKTDRFGVTLTSGDMAFAADSQLGRESLKQTDYQFTSRRWSPMAVVTVHTGLVRGSILPDETPFPMEASQDALSEQEHKIKDIVHRPVDGEIAYGVLHNYDLEVDTDSITVAASFDTPQTREPPRWPPKTIGLTPWIYHGRGIAWSVIVHSPADLAGIRPGDQIISIHGGDVYDYYRYLDSKPKFDAMTVVFKNARGVHSVDLKPAVPAP